MKILSLKPYILLAVVMLAVISCSKESAEIAPTEDLALVFRVNTRADGDAFESNINRVRVVVFEGSSIIRNVYFASVPSEMTILVREGELDFHIFANEPLDAGGEPRSEFKNILTTANIGALTMQYTPTGDPYEPALIPMYVKMASQAITNPSNVNASVERLMARVVMRLNVKKSDFPVGAFPVVDRIQITGLPSFSWFMRDNQYPATNLFVDSEEQTAIEKSSDATGVVYENVFYIPEYLLAEVTKTAKIQFSGHINGTATTCTWEAKAIGNALLAPATRYDIDRNTSYNMTGNIKGYGEYDMTISATIGAWTELTNDFPLN